MSTKSDGTQGEEPPPVKNLSTESDVTQGDEPPQMKHLYQYLPKHSIGDLATAIENHGIYGVDRFGRFRHFKLGSPEFSSALNGLEHQMAWECSQQVPGAPMEQSPADLCEALWQGEPPVPWAILGWPEGQVPDLGAVIDKPKRQSDITKIMNSLYTLIATLASSKGIDIRHPRAAQKLEELVLLDPEFADLSIGTLRDIVNKVRGGAKRKDS